MTTIVLIPGAWLEAGVWETAADTLTDRGHDVHAVTLSGLGDRSSTDARQIDLTTHVDDVVGVIEDGDLRDVVLVGHSYAGVVITGVAERIPERIARLIYVAGAVPEDGRSLFDAIGPDAAAGMQAMAAAAGDPDRLPVPSDEVLDLYYGAHGLERSSLARFRASATPHPIGTFRTTVQMGDRRAARIPRTYIRATADQPGPIGPTTPGWDYVEIDTGHWPMLTRPAELADLIDRSASAAL